MFEIDYFDKFTTVDWRDAAATGLIATLCLETNLFHAANFITRHKDCQGEFSSDARTVAVATLIQGYAASQPAEQLYEPEGAVIQLIRGLRLPANKETELYLIIDSILRNKDIVLNRSERPLEFARTRAVIAAKNGLEVPDVYGATT